MRWMLWGALAPAIVLAGCQQAANNSAPTSNATLAEIHKAENAQLAALNAKDFAGATAVYGKDAVIWVPGELPLSGDGLRGYFQKSADDPAYAATMDEGSNKSWVSADGDLAVTQFTGSDTHTVDGKPVTRRLLNQTVWQKQADGAWKNVSDVNMALPEAAAE